MDPRSFQSTGEATPIAEEVSANDANGRSAFAVSENGVLVYRGGEFKQVGNSPGLTVRESVLARLASRDSTSR